MALPGFKMPAVGGSTSGAEMMLRSLGLGDMIEVAKTFAESGAIDKILQFADALEGLNERLDKIEIAIRERPISGTAGAGAGEPRLLRPDHEPGSVPAFRRLATDDDVGVPDEPAAGELGSAGDACASGGVGGGGIKRPATRTRKAK